MPSAFLLIPMEFPTSIFVLLLVLFTIGITDYALSLATFIVLFVTQCFNEEMLLNIEISKYLNIQFI